MNIFRTFLFIGWVLANSFANAQTCASPGVDGPASLTGIVNTYHAGAGAATAGTNQVTVASLAGQRTSTRALAIGDLVLMMQVQDSAVPANAGLHEYAQIVSIAGNTLTLNRALTNGYVQSVTAAGGVTTAWRTFQVVRVPQYSSATVAAGNTVLADRWTVSNVNGQGTGGVVALDVAGNTTVNGTISVAGAGFRGGAGINGAGNRAGGVFTDANYNFNPAAVNGAVKGEGTVGTPFQIFNGTATRLVYSTTTFGQGYAAGAAGRAAQGSAGGGGNDGLPATGGNQYNSGGGGGSNSGVGGQGGNSWAQLNDAGGRGGGAVSSSVTRLALGGGGGAGSSNNNGVVDAVTIWPPDPAGRAVPPTTGVANGAAGPISSSGASGGGVVLLRTGSLAATNGVITARGYDAHNNSGGSESAGGGGAGGSISIVAATGTGAGLSLQASGGGGGYSNYFDHGPGGGGGGGFISTSTNLTGAATAVQGGALGYDGCCTGVQGNGSPKAFNSAVGVVGLLAQGGLPAGTAAGSACLPQLAVTKSTATPVVTLPGGTTAQYSINVTNALTAGAAYGVSIRDVLPLPFGLQAIAATGATVLSGTNTSGLSPTATNQSGNTTTAVFGIAGRGNVPTVSSFTIFPGGSVTVTFVVNVNTTTLTTFQNNASATFSDPTRITGGAATDSAITNPAVSPAGTYASGAAVGGTNYASGNAAAEDVQLVATTTLTVTKSNGASTVTAGGTTSYVLTYSNTGGFAANNSVIRDVVGTGLVCNTVTCTSVSGGASCPAGLVLGSPVASASVPNFFNATGLTIGNFPAASSVVITVDCAVTATGQ